MKPKKSAVVTGASEGLGRAVVPLLIKSGYRVVAVARNEQRLHQLVTEYGNENVIAMACDLAVTSERVGLIDRALASLRCDSLDLLVNNAGVGSVGKISNLPLTEFEKAFRVNTLSAIDLSQQAIARMQAGLLVNVTSGVQNRGLPFESPYCLSKAALKSFTESLRVELAGTQIKTMIFSPGPIATGFLAARTCYSDVKSAPSSKDAKTPEYVARKLMEAIHRQKQSVNLGRKANIIHRLNNFSPKLVDKILVKSFGVIPKS